MGDSESNGWRAEGDGAILDVRDLPLADGRPVAVLIDGEAEDMNPDASFILGDRSAPAEHGNAAPDAEAQTVGALPDSFIFNA